jgi:hypothetical protein
MHLNQGQIHAYLDGELHGADEENARSHLAGCAQCRAELEATQALAGSTAARLAALSPLPGEQPLSPGAARVRLQDKISHSPQEATSMLDKIFSRQYRFAWIALGVVLILGLALAFPGVRAVANTFLGLFRVEQVSVVSVNPGNLPEQLGSSNMFQSMLTDDLQIEELGDFEGAASNAEASDKAGFTVRLPRGMNGEEQLFVQPATRMSFKIDLARVNTLLGEIGRQDIQLPANLDGATVSMEMPSSVAALYGDCQFDEEGMPVAEHDPTSPNPRRPDCTTLLQVPSPTISAPPGLDIVRIGEAFLQVLGMSSEEAAQFSRNLDWTTTLIIPIPRYGASYEEVSVDGVTGTLIRQSLEDHAPQYLLIWIKDGIVYALTGPGTGSNAQNIVRTLQ